MFNSLFILYPDAKFDHMSHGGATDMFAVNQSLDHEPQLGQLPMLPPGTPPQEGWLPAHFNRPPPLQPYMGGDSPNHPMGHAVSQAVNHLNHPISVTDSVHMMTNPVMNSHGNGQDMVDNSGQNYGDYSPISMHKQVEVC